MGILAAVNDWQLDPIGFLSALSAAAVAIPSPIRVLCAFVLWTYSGLVLAMSVAFLNPGITIELVDDRLYHLDLTFCPLDSRRAHHAGPLAASARASAAEAARRLTLAGMAR